MLTHRTNVLFTKPEYHALSALARAHDTTMSQLIRRAVRQTYQIKPSDSLNSTLAHIRQLTKNMNTKGINYRELAVSDRKYED